MGKDDESNSDTEFELNTEEADSVSRAGGDRRAVNFYEHYSKDELKKVQPDRRQGDRRDQSGSNDDADNSTGQ